MSGAISRGLDHDVSEAADAWLNDPRDTVAYGRLVAAVLRRRSYTRPTLDGGWPEGDGAPPVLGESLAGDPRSVLAALRERSAAEPAGLTPARAEPAGAGPLGESSVPVVGD